MNLILIAAEAANKVIGNDGKMPWHIPEDLKHFKKKTMGHPVIMGRKTFDALERKPLPGRPNIVVSRSLDAGWVAPQGAHRVHSLKMAVKSLITTGYEQAFVIGGEQLFRAALPWASRVVLTKLYKSYEGDTVFPDLDPLKWEEFDQDDHFRASQPFTIFHYAAVNNPDVARWVDLIKE